MSISKKAMINLDLIVKYLFESIVSEASRLTRYKKNKVLGYKEIQTAVRLVLPTELAKHSISVGQIAYNNYC